MNNRTQSSISNQINKDQTTTPKYETIKLGLDVHADSIVVVRIIDHSGPQPAQRFSPVKFLDWVKTQLPLARCVHSCYEAGPFGFVLHRQLTFLGINNVVTQPVCLDERHKGVNHDKSDARELAQRLDRYVAGNRYASATVRVPTPEEEQARIRSRQREQLKRELQRISAQGRSLLLSQGCREKGAWWKTARWETLRPRLPDWLTERLDVFCRLIASLNTELNQATAELSKVAPATRPLGMGG
jgi:transposase